MFVHVVYPGEVVDRIVKFESGVTAMDVLCSIPNGSKCTLILFNDDNTCMGHSELFLNYQCYPRC